MPRPRSVTFLALFVLFIGAFNALGLTSGVRRYTVLASLPLRLPPAVPIVSAAFWSVVFGLLAIGLWRVKRWARWGTLAAVTLYLAQAWVQQLVFGQSDYLRTTIWFYAGLDGVLLLYVWGSLLRPGIRQAFSN
jgi:uncharacterized membrane protein (DUF2068 family)